MEPSMFSIQCIPNSWSQIADTHYPKHGIAISQGLLNDPRTQKFTQNGGLIPVPNHVQGTQFPSNIIEFDKVPPQLSRMKTYKRTRMAASKGKIIEFEEAKEPKKRKRFRKQNYNKVSSFFRGVTKCKGRFESFVWDKDPKSTGKKGKTVYIGGFKHELEAARAHDLIALKIWGKFAYINFPVLCYLKEMVEMESMTLRECILEIRRRSKDSITTTFYELYNLSSLARAFVDQMAENNAIGNALINLNFITMQPMLQNIGQQSQEPITSQNQSENFHEKNNLLDSQFLYQQNFTTMQPVLQKSGQTSQQPITWQSQNENAGENLLDNQFLYHKFATMQSILQLNIGERSQEPITLRNQIENVGGNLLDDNQFLYQNLATMQSMLQKIGQRPQVPITWQNQNENVGENLLDNQFLYQNFTIMQPMLQRIGQSSQEPITFPHQNENIACVNLLDSQFLNQKFTTMQSMLSQIGQRTPEPITFQNMIENVNYENLYRNQFLYNDQYHLSALAFQNNPSFQSDPSLPLWSYGLRNALIQDHANGLGNVLNWESPISQMGDENPAGAGNDSVSSFGSSCSEGFHSVEPNIQQYEALTLQAEPVQRYEPFQYGSATNTNSQSENMVDNDWDVCQYLNLDGPNMDD